MKKYFIKFFNSKIEIKICIISVFANIILAIYGSYQILIGNGQEKIGNFWRTYAAIAAIAAFASLFVIIYKRFKSYGKD